MGYLWAAAAVVAIPAAFMANEGLAKKLVDVTGMKISPVYTGGDVERRTENPGYTTVIHKPVFACLIGESKTGFVQVDWQAKDKLPPTLSESVDLDGDRKADFTVTLDTAARSASISPQGGIAKGVLKVYTLKNGFTVRVILKR